VQLKLLGIGEPALVLIVGANPEPNEAIRGFGSQGSITGRSPHRPEATDLLEVQRWMPRISLQQLIVSISSALHCLGKQAITFPRNQPWYGESQTSSPSGSVFLESVVDQCIESASRSFALDLFIPETFGELFEPRLHASYVIGRQLLNGGGNLFDCTHGTLHVQQMLFLFPCRWAHCQV